MHSGFCDALCEKGQMSGYFDRLPVWLVTAPYPGWKAPAWRCNRCWRASRRLAGKGDGRSDNNKKRDVT